MKWVWNVLSGGQATFEQESEGDEGMSHTSGCQVQNLSWQRGRGVHSQCTPNAQTLKLKHMGLPWPRNSKETGAEWAGRNVEVRPSHVLWRRQKGIWYFLSEWNGSRCGVWTTAWGRAEVEPEVEAESPASRLLQSTRWNKIRLVPGWWQQRWERKKKVLNSR